MGIAKAPLPPRSNAELLSRPGQVPQPCVVHQVMDLRPAGHLDQQGWGAGPSAIFGAAPAAIPGGKTALVLEIQQGLQVGRGLQNHVSAAAAIPTGRTTRRHEFLSTEGHNAVSTTASPPPQSAPGQ